MLHIRPANYAHEKWPEISDRITIAKRHARNKYWQVHVGKHNNYLRVVEVTKAQRNALRILQELPGYYCNGWVDFETIAKLPISVGTMKALVKKGLFVVSGNRVFPV